MACGSNVCLLRGEDLIRESARREVQHYHFLCLSVFKTATRTFATTSLVFTQTFSSSEQMMAFFSGAQR